MFKKRKILRDRHDVLLYIMELVMLKSPIQQVLEGMEELFFSKTLLSFLIMEHMIMKINMWISRQSNKNPARKKPPSDDPIRPLKKQKIRKIRKIRNSKKRPREDPLDFPRKVRLLYKKLPFLAHLKSV